MSVPNCEGCECEWGEVCYQVSKGGLHLATTPSRLGSYPFGRHHFGLILVDDNGRMMMW